MDRKVLSMMDSIKASEELKEKTYQNVLCQKKGYRKSVLALTMVCLCLISFIGYQFFQSNHNKVVAYSYITIDVNPSMELILDKDDYVISTKAYNKEAKMILKNIEYHHKNYQDVLNDIINDKEYQKYLTDNSQVQISVYCKDSNKCDTLRDDINQYVNTTCIKDRYESICIDEKTHHQAHDCHISSGKYVIIQDILSIDSTYSMKELSKKSISELKSIYSSLTKEDYSYESKYYNETHHKEYHHQESHHNKHHH